MNPSWVPFSGEISGSTAVIMPMPMNDTELISSTRPAAAKLASPKLMERNAATTANRRAVHVQVATAGLDALRDEHDRERVCDGVQKPGQLPPGESPDQVHVALDDAGEADQLTPQRASLLRADHAGTPLRLSSSSSSNERPVAFRNACSSVSAW